MVPAIDPRRRGIIAGLAVGCLLIAAMVGAEEPAARREIKEPALLDRSVWFARYLSDQADLPDGDDDAVPLERPRAERTDEPDPLPLDRPPLDQPPLDQPPLGRPPLEDPILPPTPIPPSPGRASTDDSLFAILRRSRSRASFARRRRPIAVLGDSLVDAGQMDVKFTVMDYTTWPATTAMASGSTDIPLIAAATRRRISSNSSVLPTDRLIFSYQRFQNALSAETAHPVAGDSRHVLDLDRMTVGFEKTLFGEQWSIDVRLPVMSRFDVAASDFTLTNGRLGNASLVIKHAWYQTDAIAWGVGIGIDAPTGSDGRIELPNTEIVVANDAFHALPYLGLLVAPTEKSALQAFAQLDIPLNGNEVELLTPSNGSFSGQFNEQQLLFLSLSASHWICQNPDARHLRGLAALLELHYTTSLDDSDRVAISAAGDSFELSNPFKVADILNVTAGLQAQIGMTDFRVAAVVPWLGGGNRPFDAEFLLQINRRY